MSSKTWVVIAGATGAVGVILGAFGAHALPEMLDSWGVERSDIANRLENFRTGVQYHMYHAAALVGIATLARGQASRRLAVAGVAIFAGVIIFSGSLYAIALCGMKLLGAIVPVGGVLLVAGWFTLALAGLGPGSCGVPHTAQPPKGPSHSA